MIFFRLFPMKKPPTGGFFWRPEGDEGGHHSVEILTLP